MLDCTHLSEIQVFHFGEQMFKCPRDRGWRQKMRCEKMCDSGGEHIFPRGGKGPGFPAQPHQLQTQALRPLHQQPLQLVGSATPHFLHQAWTFHCARTSRQGTTPKMSNFPWGLLLYPSGWARALLKTISFRGVRISSEEGGPNYRQVRESPDKSQL